MNEEPRLLAGRYEVGDLIGRGGMAEVHIGYDTRLGRNVAIKILRADLARDPSFQTRFRREAQAAAGLNHPSIVAVYDTGEDQIPSATGTPQAVPFIVMEYVEGHTVRDILKGDVAAPIEEAVEITMGVLSGLEYAHAAGLVHRDIKPANVMLTPTGAVKVMDFGIARALADVGQTMTQTQAVVGTAQYLSPEQARGENVDARSDLYSAGCLFFELLTGRPPFMGDSPVSVAYQHVREAAPKPSQFASDVPAALDAVVARALQKDRNQRYSSAQEFMTDLQRAMGHTPAPGTSPQQGQGPWGPVAAGAAAGAGLAGAVGAGAAAVGAGAPAGPSPSSPYAPGYPGPAGQGAGATTVMPVTGPPNVGGWDSVVAGGGRGPVNSGPHTATLVRDEDYIEDDGRKRLWIQIGVAAAAVIGLAALVIALFAMNAPDNGADEPTVGEVTIPILVNFKAEDAEARLVDLKLEVVIEEEISADVKPGLVTRTDPDAGAKVAEGSLVTIYVSEGPDEVEIPDIRGLSELDAKAKLEDAGLEIGQVIQEHDPDLAAGRASKTDPAAGTVANAGASVVLYVSDGLVELPELRNGTSTAAQQALVALGLVASIQEVETLDYDAGTVFEQDPLPGLVTQGSTVTVRVAKAPSTVTVPDVVNRTKADATSMLTAAKLKVTIETASSPTVPADSVISQSIPPGTKVAIDTTIKIVVSSGPASPGP